MAEFLRHSLNKPPAARLHFMYLEAISEGKTNTEELPGKSQSEHMAYLHWYLLKTSFNEGTFFSKGTFNLRLDDDLKTPNLYQYLKGDAYNLYKNKLIER